MKKLLSMMLVSAMAISLLAACGGGSDSSGSGNGGASGSSSSDAKFGFVLIGDENEGYTFSHIDGIQKALANNGLSEENAIWKYSIPEDESCYDAIVDCIDNGALAVFTNSYGHQFFAQQAAEENPDTQIVSMTGDLANVSGLDNYKNSFTKIYEARYVGGIVAGMKIKELADNGELTSANMDGNNVKVGYVGAYPYAEVVSGYTAFFLGIKSVYPDVVMDVTYTNSWFDITAEKEGAESLINRGCVVIGQHADSTGAPQACEDALNKGSVVYSVGYNVDMLSVAPNAALTSPTNLWEAYYTEAIAAALAGESIEKQWARGFDDNAVALTPLGDSCAEGTQEAVDAAIAGIKDGSIKVFDVSAFTVEGKAIDESVLANVEPDDNYEADTAVVVSDGGVTFFDESNPEFRAAPYFELRIDGITELN